MKNSGIQWIGDIPQDWNVRKLKYCILLYTGNSIKDNEKDNYSNNINANPYIATKDIDYPTLNINYENGMYTKCDDKTFKIAPKDSILLCIEGGSAGKKIAYLNRNVSFVNKLCCLNPININSKYLYYYVQSPSFNEEFNNNISGLIGGVSVGKLSNFNISFPSLEEQQRIANYLDEKCSKIDETIEKEKAIIEKLKEYKQSLITETVTKGLNPNVPLKDSGIDWIGSIPQHWETMKIKHSCWLKGRIGWQGLTAKEYQDNGAYLITGTDFKNGSIDWNTCVHISEERYQEAPEIHIQENDLLITKDGTIGKVAITKNTPQKVSLNSGVLLIRQLSNKYIEKYLYYCLISNIFWTWFNSNKTGNSTILHLYQEKFKEFIYTLPPMEEQEEISKYLDEKCNAIDNAITQRETLIDKLTEYKKSLIYECVTGKKEV